MNTISWDGFGWVGLILFGLIVFLVGLVTVIMIFRFLFKLIHYVSDILMNKRRLLRKVRRLNRNIDNLSDNQLHSRLSNIYRILEILYDRNTTNELADHINYNKFPEIWVRCKDLLEEYQFPKADLSNLRRDAKKVCEILLNAK